MSGSPVVAHLARLSALIGLALLGGCGDSGSSKDAATDTSGFDLKTDKATDAAVDTAADVPIGTGSGGATGTGGSAGGSGGSNANDGSIGAVFTFQGSIQGWAPTNGATATISAETPPDGTADNQALAINYPAGSSTQAITINQGNTLFPMPVVGSTITMDVYVDADEVPWQWAKLLIVDHPSGQWNWFGGFFSCPGGCPVRQWFTVSYTVPAEACKYGLPSCTTTMLLSGNIVDVGIQFAVAATSADGGATTPSGTVYIDNVSW